METSSGEVFLLLAMMSALMSKANRVTRRTATKYGRISENVTGYLI